MNRPTPPHSTDPVLVEFRALRSMLGTRADEVAARAAVDKSSLSYWECGHRSPHLDKLRAIVAAIGFDIALVPAEPAGEAAEATTAWIRQANAERDKARAERDRLVEAIAHLMSLPPQTIADAYGVGYSDTEVSR